MLLNQLDHLDLLGNLVEYQGQIFNTVQTKCKLFHKLVKMRLVRKFDYLLNCLSDFLLFFLCGVSHPKDSNRIMILMRVDRIEHIATFIVSNACEYLEILELSLSKDI